MIDTEYLSFSSVSDIVQGEKETGADLIYQLAIEKEEVLKNIRKKEAELSSLNNRLNSLKTGVKHTVACLSLEFPLAVQREDCIVVVTDTPGVMSIERNVL